LCSRVDLCHQATDHQEEGEDDEQIHMAISNSFSSIKELLPLHMVHTHVTAHSRVILANSDSGKLDNKVEPTNQQLVEGWAHQCEPCSWRKSA
jgi:hypothetical protein